MKTVNFELTTTFKYAPGNGELVNSNFIELREPSGKVSSYCCQIESLIQSGLISMSSILGDDVIAEAKETALESKKEDDEIGDPESMLSVMTSGGIDMEKVVLNFRELFKEVGFIDGEKKLTHDRLNDMSHQDFKMMMGVYAVNFIMN